MKAIAAYLLIAVSLCACGHSAVMISERGNYLTYDHGTAPEEFQAAYGLAQTQCQKTGASAKQTTSTCPGRCITNFECVKP
jgi:hypothetical protein